LPATQKRSEGRVREKLTVRRVNIQKITTMPPLVALSLRPPPTPTAPSPAPSAGASSLARRRWASPPPPWAQRWRPRRWPPSSAAGT
ncbi:hypothetical protein BAE44_0010244, partial [Dichanthelium oligosanthes]